MYGLGRSGSPSGAFEAYAQSKLANVLFAQEFASRFQLHPEDEAFLWSVDESVRGIVPCAAMTTKKCIGRYVCYLIIDPTMAAMASVLLATWEFCAAAHVRNRDIFLYSIGLSSASRMSKVKTK